MKSAWEHFYHIFSSLWGEIIWKITLLLEFEILGVFVDTLTADERCAVPECENLQFPIQMILSSTRNFFPQIFVRLMESTSNLKLFQKKKIVIANIFPKLQTVKDFVRPISKKRSFRISFHSQHVKGSQTLVNLHGSLFIIFFHHSGKKLFGKYLPHWNLRS